METLYNEQQAEQQSMTTPQQTENSEEQLLNKTFKFDRSFQEKIIQSMVVDHPWAAQFSEVLELDYFGYAYLKLVASSYLKYYKQYKEFPSQELLLGILKDSLRDSSDAILTEQVKILLKRIATNQDYGDLAFVKDQSLSWCKKMALTKALDKSISYAENEENHEKIIDVLKKAICAGNSHTSGLDLLDDIDARYSETYRQTVPTGLKELDQRKILNGGLGAGELGIVVAPTGVGKSHILVHFGAQAILQGKNVAHYTFELNERNMGIRYDSHILGINSTDCFEHKDEIKKFYEENSETLGTLRIKYYTTGIASVGTLRAHMQKLASEGFRPDMVLVDYAGVMRSANRHELMRIELKKVCEELREFADELQVPVWTALQSNKEGANADIIDLTNMAESYAQAHVADFVLGLSRQSSQKSKGFGNVFIAKNRAGMDGIKYAVHLDTARSTLKFLTADEQGDFLTDIEDEKKDQAADYLRRTYRDMNNARSSDKH